MFSWKAEWREVNLFLDVPSATHHLLTIWCDLLSQFLDIGRKLRPATALCWPSNKAWIRWTTEVVSNFRICTTTFQRSIKAHKGSTRLMKKRKRQMANWILWDFSSSAFSTLAMWYHEFWIVYTQTLTSCRDVCTHSQLVLAWPLMYEVGESRFIRVFQQTPAFTFGPPAREPWIWLLERLRGCFSFCWYNWVVYRRSWETNKLQAFFCLCLQ